MTPNPGAHDVTDDTQDSQAYLETIKFELGGRVVRNGEADQQLYYQFNGSARFEQGRMAGGQAPKDASLNDGLPAVVENSQLDETAIPDTSSRSQTSNTKESSSRVEAAAEPTLVTTDIEVPNSNEAEIAVEGNSVSRYQAAHGVPAVQTIKNQQHAPRSLIQLRNLSGGKTDRKMDMADQSPTQVNEDRNYEAEGEVYDSLPSTLARDTHRDTDGGDRTLQPDDTGAVNFENIHDIPRPSSQVSEDGGFENTRGDWRNTERTSQQFSSIYTPFKPQKPSFETPALPKNPFAAGKDAAVPLGGTQLFGQTQFSSAMKQVSPGSSRPSPHVPMSNLSPNIAETSPLKNRANVSSPTDIRTSSPQRLDEIPTTLRRNDSLARIEEETPSASRSTGEDVVPESPTNKAPRSSSARQPLVHYETMKKSQERKYQDEAEYHVVPSDSDSDGAIKGMERRKKLERMRAQAAKEMASVRFTPKPRPTANDRPRAKRLKTKTDPPPRVEESPVALVEDSQQRPQPLPPLKTEAPAQGDDGETQSQPDEMDTGDGTKPNVTRNDTEETVEERILATSPIGPDNMRRRSESELPVPDIATNRILDSSNDTGETSSLPPLNRKPASTYRSRTRQQRRRTILSSSATEVPTPPRSAAVVQSSPAPETHHAVPEADVASNSKDSRVTEELKVVEMVTPAGSTKQTPSISAGLRVTRSRTKIPSPLTPLTKHVDVSLAASSSSGDLSSVPLSSAVTTPGTRDGTQPEQTESIADTSPVTGDGLGKEMGQGDETRASPHGQGRNLRTSRRLVRYGSESTDELFPSSVPGALERSILYPKRSYGQLRQSMGQTQRGNKLFGGMAFALSFQSSMKPQDRDKLEARIVHAGGLILEDFEALFEPSPVMDTTSPVFDAPEPLILKSTFSDIGFTALIADNHSRKAKYMQALALGLPCVARQWIDACLDSGSIVDWEHYLLCAGASALLGNAIRSRTLPPYPAADARLADVVASRPQLLHGQRILAVVDSKKRQSEAKRPYIFLAQALGPSVSRVFTTKQASDALAENAKAGRPFDWLYLDQGTEAIKAILSGATTAKAKKRKRGASATVVPTQLGDTRVLNDELIIQTLILGRVVQEQEMSSLRDS